MEHESDGSTWAELKYEKLGSFCHHCGKVVHEEEYCSAATGKNASSRMLGPWLRAPQVGIRKGNEKTPRQHESKRNQEISLKVTENDVQVVAANLEKIMVEQEMNNSKVKRPQSQNESNSGRKGHELFKEAYIIRKDIAQQSQGAHETGDDLDEEGNKSIEENYYNKMLKDKQVEEVAMSQDDTDGLTTRWNIKKMEAISEGHTRRTRTNQYMPKEETSWYSG